MSEKATTSERPTTAELMSENRRRRASGRAPYGSKGPTMALSDWNQGNDPTLEVLGAAERALSPRGFSAAESDRAAAEEAMRQAMDVEVDPALPAQAKTIVQRKKIKIRRDFQDFNRDADEYSGKKARDYYDAPEPIEVRRQAQEEEQAKAEAEKAVQRQGLSASDYWQRNPTSRRTASVTDWSSDPEVAAAIATGNISAIEKATANARDKNRVARGLPKGPGTTEGDAAVLASRKPTSTEVVSSDPNGPTVTTSRPSLVASREVDLMDLRAEAGRRSKADKSRPDMEKFNATAEERNNRVRDARSDNKEQSAQRFGRFVANQEIRKREEAQADAYLKSFRDRAKASRAATSEAVAGGRVPSEEFWAADADLRSTNENLNRMSRQEQLSWAKKQIEEEQKARAERIRIANERTTRQDPFIASFLDGKEPISNLLSGYFSNINYRR